MIKGLDGVKEYRDIKITSKRQFTIPKSFFDALNIEDEMEAYLLEDGIFLKPIHKTETIYDKDIREIIRKTMDEGLEKEEFIKELTSRISQYDRFIANRIQEFKEDMRADSESEDDEGDVDFNGLDVFFDEENGEAVKGN